MTKDIEKKVYHRIRLKSEELFSRAEEWLLAGTSTYQFTSRGLAQYNLPGLIIKSSPKSKSVYIICHDKNCANFLEKRLKEVIRN